ncbi:MAG TPA: hypothetical protein VHU40_06180 [Polyangia bacterium]|jgi:hypothetical protein|nr:hypothetical protein [Polyangia bacterium]
MKTSSKPKFDVRSGGNSDAKGMAKGRATHLPRVGAVATGLLALFVAQASASATPGAVDAFTASPSAGQVNLGLDSRTAGRLLADARGGASDDESPKAMDTKPDEMKLTVTKGNDIKKPAATDSSGDKFAFVKDWPFWVIVGGVVVAGAATYMIVRNNNQGHSCLADTFTGGCHGAN